nr:DNA/RNA polymerase superfamily protein [Tanacetum cinerariifolium]
MRQRRWLELLKDYDTNIQYQLGKDNVVADALSKKSGMIAGIKVDEEIIRDLERLDIELYVRGQHGYWASRRVEPDLISRIKEAQKEDSEIWTIVENLDEQTAFCLDEDDVLWQGTSVCVPNDATLREALLTEAHSSPFSVHPGKANVVADALSRKSGMIAGIKVEEEIIRDLERLDIELYVSGQQGHWASLRIEPVLISWIKEAQKDDNVLWQDTRLVVPNDVSLREALLTEAHSSPYSVHLGSTKMYHDLKHYFWWSGMKRDVATFVAKCLICQQVKIEHQRASGLLQQLDIPVWKWDEISMDFVTGLPQTQRRHDAIWVVVDRLTKSAHFLPIRKDYSVSRLAEIFQQEIVDYTVPIQRLYQTETHVSRLVFGKAYRKLGEPGSSSVLPFIPRQTKAWGTRLKFSTAFHPQTDGQSERTIQTLEDMLRSCALEWTGNWDNYICLVEFAYNNSWHASIKCAPFEMLYGWKCRAPICWDQVGERVIEGPEMIEVTNAKVAVAKEKLKEARTRQKSYADKHRRSLEFQPGDHVFLKVSPARGVRRFGIKGKLSPRFIGPFEILDRVGEVSYRLALPPQLSHVHNVFHVSLLRG